MWQVRPNAIVPLVLALAGIACGSDETRPAAPPAVAPAPAPPPPDAGVPAPAAKAPVPAAPGEMIDWKGELPSDFPGDVPQYPGSKVTEAKGTNDAGLTVTFDSADALETASTNYADSLAATGWATRRETGDEGMMIFAEKDDRTLLAIVQQGGQGTLIRILVAPKE
jgi:hypothetical protein